MPIARLFAHGLLAMATLIPDATASPWFAMRALGSASPRLLFLLRVRTGLGASRTLTKFLLQWGIIQGSSA